MTSVQEQRLVILVVEDVDETRYGIERLLTFSGYQVTTARGEEEAIWKARLDPPDLILLSLGLDAPQILPIAERIRAATGSDEEIPVVVFCVATLEEGAEIEAVHNVYMTRPDNFDQLRALIGRLLGNVSRHG